MPDGRLLAAGRSQTLAEPDGETAEASWQGYSGHDKEFPLTDWIIIVALYAFATGFFRMLGGLGAAADAFQRWGRSSATRRTTHVSPSSS